MHVEVYHPCIQHKLAELRSVDQPIGKFRELISEITQLLSYKALENLDLVELEAVSYTHLTLPTNREV